MNRIMKDNLFQLKPEVTIYYHEEQKQYIINIGGYDEGSIDVPHYCFDPVLNQEGETKK